MSNVVVATEQEGAEGASGESNLLEFLAVNKLGKAKAKLLDLEVELDELVQLSEGELTKMVDEMALGVILGKRFVNGIKALQLKSAATVAPINPAKQQRIVVSEAEDNCMALVAAQREEISAGISSVSKAIRALGENEKLAQTNIDDAFDAITKAVIDAKKGVYSKVSALAAEKKTKLTAQMNGLKKYCSELSECQKSTNSMIYDSNIQRAQRKKKIVAISEAILKKNISTVLVAAPEMRIGMSKKNMADLLKIINRLCIVSDTDVPVAPKVKVTEVTHNSVSVLMQNEAKQNCAVPSKYIIYSKTQSAANADDEKLEWKKQSEIENDTNNGWADVVAVVKMLRSNESYAFRVRAQNENGTSEYSQMAQFTTLSPPTPPQLKWSRTLCSSSAKFKSDTRVTLGWYAAGVDYVIDAAIDDVFCLEFHVSDCKENGNRDAIFGFVPFEKAQPKTNWDNAVKHPSLKGFGVYLMCAANGNYSTTLHRGNGKTNLSSVKYQKNDRIGFRVDMKLRKICLFYNKRNIGVVFEDIPAKLVPAVSGNGYGHSKDATIDVVALPKDAYK